MFQYTDTEISPWYEVDSNKKRYARLNVISHLLSMIPYEDVPHQEFILPERQTDEGYVPAKIDPSKMIPDIASVLAKKQK